MATAHRALTGRIHSLHSAYLAQPTAYLSCALTVRLATHVLPKSRLSSNCTWGFHSPTPFPLDKTCTEPTVTVGVEVKERGNSTTCPRQMLCDYNVLPDGRVTKPITWCNIEGYNGMSSSFLPLTKHMLSQMPGGRCPYPPGDVPGLPGLDRYGHWVG